jgi:hypothetical protein
MSLNKLDVKLAQDIFEDICDAKCNQHISQARKNLIGQRFGKLTVIGKNIKQSGKGQITSWVCKCDCGNEIVASTRRLQRDKIESCGCVTQKANRWFPGRFKPNEEVVNWFFAMLCYNAEKRNLPQNLSKSQVKKLITQKCYYCGRPPAQKLFKASTYKCNTIDRIDNTKGYEMNNVVPCCKECNTVKNMITKVMTVKQFKYWISKVYSHWIMPSEKLSSRNKARRKKQKK